MLYLGVMNALTAERQTENGFYLADKAKNTVLLPNKYVPENMQPGDAIDVFVYKDSLDRIVATTRKPLLMLGEYACLEAKSVNEHGAFFDWGLEKDLFVPHSNQVEPVEEGDFFVVYMYLDEKSDRLAGTTRIMSTLLKEVKDISVGDEVDLLPFEETEIGISVIVNNAYAGMIYKNEIFTNIQVGDALKGYVKKIRDDHKLDISLNKFGYRGVDANIKKLYKILKENNGYMRLTDKSSPEEIYAAFGMSKKVFKKAIGGLFKSGTLDIRSTGIKLIEKTEKKD